ncbi:hypothetical protein D9M69_735200 [compost metagenome]
MQQSRQPAEAFEQLLGQLEHVLAGHAGAQQQRQQLGVGQRGGAPRHEFFARPGVEREILECHETLLKAGPGRDVAPILKMRVSLSGHLPRLCPPLLHPCPKL